MLYDKKPYHDFQFNESPPIFEPYPPFEFTKQPPTYESCFREIVYKIKIERLNKILKKTLNIVIQAIIIAVAFSLLSFSGLLMAEIEMVPIEIGFYWFLVFFH